MGRSRAADQKLLTSALRYVVARATRQPNPPNQPAQPCAEDSACAKSEPDHSREPSTTSQHPKHSTPEKADPLTRPQGPREEIDRTT